MSQMNKNKIHSWIMRSIAIYVILSLIGCTPGVMKMAREYSTRESKYWTIEDVAFAAIRDRRFVRLCVKLQRPLEEAFTEIEFDLKDVEAQLKELSDSVVSIRNQQKLNHLDESTTTNMNKSVASSSLKESATHHYVSCDSTLEENEQRLEIVRMKVEGASLSGFLDEAKHQTNGEPALFLLEIEGRNYLAFGSSESEFPDLGKYAIRCYGEDQRTSGYYFLIPFSILLDAGAIYIAVILIGICIILLPLCLMKSFNQRDRPSSKVEPFYYPPPAIAQPDCR